MIHAIPKVVIITEIIAPYRIPVFNALAEKAEIELHVIFLSENDPGLRNWRVYKDEIKFEYEVLPSWRCRFASHSVLLNRGMTRALTRIKPDVVLCGGYNYFASWQAAHWCNARCIPFMLWSESTTYDKRRELAPLELIKRRFFNRCTAFVVPGKSSANYLQSLGIRESTIFTAPNAVDNALFMRCARAAQQQKTQTRLRLNLPVRYLLYVGRLVREKGVYELLDAYAQLPSSVRSETALVLAGSGSERRELAKRASRIERGNIRFLDFVHRDELAEVYALADALVFPTHSDPWGLVVNEAMACGLPVMTTPVAGCAQDLVHQGVNGFLVEPGDVASLSHAMAKLSEDSQLRERMSLASREQIERYSPETWAEGILSAVQSVRLGL